MKIKIIRALLLLLMIADMLFIFFNSAQDSSDSSSASQSVTEMVAPVLIPNYDDMDEDAKMRSLLSLDGVLREAAHLLQFVPLGFSLFLLLCTYGFNDRAHRIKLAVTLGFGLIYAFSDEIHQLFVPGRSFQLFDVMMDVIGVALGCIGAITVMLIAKKIAHRPKENNL